MHHTRRSRCWPHVAPHSRGAQGGRARACSSDGPLRSASRTNERGRHARARRISRSAVFDEAARGIEYRTNTTHERWAVFDTAKLACSKAKVYKLNVIFEIKLLTGDAENRTE